MSDLSIGSQGNYQNENMLGYLKNSLGAHLEQMRRIEALGKKAQTLTLALCQILKPEDLTSLDFEDNQENLIKVKSLIAIAKGWSNSGALNATDKSMNLNPTEYPGGLLAVKFGLFHTYMVPLMGEENLEAMRFNAVEVVNGPEPSPARIHSVVKQIIPSLYIKDLFYPMLPWIDRRDQFKKFETVLEMKTKARIAELLFFKK